MPKAKLLTDKQITETEAIRCRRWGLSLSDLKWAHDEIAALLAHAKAANARIAELEAELFECRQDIDEIAELEAENARLKEAQRIYRGSPEELYGPKEGDYD